MRHYLLSIFVLHGTLLWGQSSISFDRLTTKEGLAHNQVRSIVQDKSGFMWFGTTGGLQKYDGTSFQTFKNDPLDSNSLLVDRIRSLLVDKNGGLWIGTFGGGLSFLKDGEFTHYLHDPNDPNSISDNSVEALAQSEDGTLWIGTRSGGLCRFKDGLFTSFQFDESNDYSLQHNGVFSLLLDSKDRLWVGTYGGGLHLMKGDKFYQYSSAENSQVKLCGNLIISLTEDSEGSIWAGTWQKGISKISLNEEGFPISSENLLLDRRRSNGSVLASIEFKGQMYFGTWGNGLKVWENYKVTSYTNDAGKKSTISNNYIESIFVDKAGYVWVGTYGGGINRIAFSSFITYRSRAEPLGINHDFITDIVETEDGSIFVGTLGGGLNRIKDGEFSYFRHKPGDPKSLGDPTNTIWNIEEASDNTIWVGTENGVEQLVGDKFNHFIYTDPEGKIINNLIYCVTEIRSGDILFGTWDGKIIKIRDGQFEEVFNAASNVLSEANHPAFDILEARDGAIWSTIESYALVRIEDGTVTHKFFEWDDSKTNVPETRSIVEDINKPVVWVGTSLGLFKIDIQKDEITKYDTKDGLVSNRTASVVQDLNGNIWITTMSGLSRFDPKSETFTNFTDLDGLQGNQFVRNSRFINPETGKIYIGGTNGFNAFHPDSITIDKTDPEVAITGLQVLYKPVVPKDESGILNEEISRTQDIALTHDDKVFSFDFSTVNYSRLFQTYHYAFYLEGYEKDWNYAGKRTFATYSNIPPGNYVFKVKASETGGNWDNPVTFINIKILPPWWYTWWAKALAAVLFVGLTYGFYKFRIRNIERINAKLKKLVDRRTSELSKTNSKLMELSEYKDQMTSMIVHDLKNPLNTVFNLTEKPEVLRAAQQMLNLVTNMLDIQKFEEAKIQIQQREVRILGIVEQAIEQLDASSSRKSVTLKNMVDPKAVVLADPDIILRVLVNLLSNAIKFSPANSAVEISTLELPETWQISVKDYGPGIPASAKKKIFELYGQLQAKEFGVTPSTGLGLTFCKQAIKAHNGFIGVYSKPDKGATFYFTLAKSQKIVFSQDDDSENVSKTFQLSEEDRAYLSGYVERLKNFEIYEFTKITKVIDEIEGKNENLLQWKENFKNAIFSSNTEKFKDLIKDL